MLTLELISSASWGVAPKPNITLKTMFNRVYTLPGDRLSSIESEALATAEETASIYMHVKGKINERRQRRRARNKGYHSRDHHATRKCNQPLRNLLPIERKVRKLNHSMPVWLGGKC